MNLPIKIKKLKTISIILLVATPLLFNSCAAAKSKKCNCPTFGDTKKH